MPWTDARCNDWCYDNSLCIEKDSMCASVQIYTSNIHITSFSFWNVFHYIYEVHDVFFLLLHFNQKLFFFNNAVFRKLFGRYNNWIPTRRKMSKPRDRMWVFSLMQRRSNYWASLGYYLLLLCWQIHPVVHFPHT